MNNSRVASYVDIKSLRLPQESLKIHSAAQHKRLRKTAVDYGQVRPLIIDDDGVILDGGATYLALLAEGVTSVWVLQLKDLTPAQVKALPIALHRSSLGSRWNETKLRHELGDLLNAGFNMISTGYTVREAERLELKPLSLTNTPNGIAGNVPHVCRPGDIWTCGRHIVGCGNWADTALIERMQGGRKADLGAIEYHKASANISLSASGQNTHDRVKHLNAQLAVLKTACHPRALIHVGLDWRQLPDAMTAVEQSGLQALDLSIRVNDKSGTVGLYANNFTVALAVSVSDSSSLPNAAAKKQSNVWHNPSHAALDPQAQSISSAKRLIANTTKPKGAIFDLSLGEGAMLLAAEAGNRIYVGLEPCPTLLETAIRRWEVLTGQKAQHLETGVGFASFQIH